MSVSLTMKFLLVTEDDCEICQGFGWICEHHDTAWTSMTGVVRNGTCPTPDCPGPGKPCPACSAASGGPSVFVDTGRMVWA